MDITNDLIMEREAMTNIERDLKHITTIENNKHNMAWIQVHDNTYNVIKEYGGVTNYGASTPLSEFTVEMILNNAKEEYCTILHYKTI